MAQLTPLGATARALPIYVSYEQNTNNHWEHDDTPTFSSLHHFVSIQFNIKQFELTYTRAQGSPITIVDDKHLNEALQWSVKTKREKLQLFVNDDVSRQFPLCQFDTNDICGALKQAFHNPSNDKAMSQLEIVFTERELSGNKWMESDDIKDTIKVQMLELMTETTFNIIFQWFDEWKKKGSRDIMSETTFDAMLQWYQWHDNDSRDIKSKSAKQMARILYQYPLNHLMTALRKESIDGQHINVILDDNKYIQTHTGWSDKQIHEIKSRLLPNWTLTRKEFIDRIDSILSESSTAPLSTVLTDKIKHFLVELDQDVEQIHFDIKNNGNIQYFSDIVIQMVNDIIRQYPEETKEESIDCDLIHTIYETVARCFIVSDDGSPNWNSVFKLSDCTCDHIIWIVDKFVLKRIDDSALNDYKSKIIDCIQTNQINGKQLHDAAISRDEFAIMCCDHCQYKPLHAPSLKLFDELLSFDIPSCIQCSASRTYRIVRTIRQGVKWGLPVQIVYINRTPTEWDGEYKVELIKRFVTKELNTDRFALKYRDEDDNELNIHDENDLIEAFQCAQSKNAKQLQ
eukprot:807365_1